MRDTLRRVRDVVTSRWFIKTAFFLYFVSAIVRLVLFKSWAEGTGPHVGRPEAVAGLLPVGHFTSFIAWLKGGGWDSILPAGLVIIIGALLVSLFFKRGFCGYICPVGTFWEYFSLLGRKLLGKNFKLPRWLDIAGRVLQIVLTVGCLGFLLIVSVQEALQFRQMPYMWVADLKILSEFANPTFLIAVIVCAGLSFFLGPVWCRYLCPVGGLYSLVGLASPEKVHRNEQTCTHCGKCAHACHAFIDPSKVKAVNSTVCDGCMDCVKACPEKNTLQAKSMGKFVIPAWGWGLGIVLLWLTIYFIALATGNWHTTIPDSTFQQVIQSGLLDAKTKGFF